MLIQLLFFLLLLTFLFLLSQKIQTSVFNNVFILTKSKKLSIGILIVLLLPGTIIHELSHFLMATILRVQTGELTVFPAIENDEVKAGKLFLGQTDPFRLTIIGLAPILIGLFLIYILCKLFIPDFSYLITHNSQPTTSIMSFVICYLLFVISITMFSSKKDLQGLIISLPIVVLIFGGLYFAGVRVFLENNLLWKIEAFMSNLNFYLLLTVIIDLSIFLLLSGNLFLWQKILRRKIG